MPVLTAVKMRSSRILLVSFVGNNRWSGMGRWTHSIADCLAEQGHKTTLWFIEDFPRLRNHPRASVLLLPVSLAWRIWNRRQEFDVVVIHEPSGFWYGLVRRLHRGVPPMIAMCHNVESKFIEELARFSALGLAVFPHISRLKTALFRIWQSKGAIRFADHVICLSSIDKAYLVRRLGVSPQRITLMTNGVGTERFHTSRRPGTGRVLFVGGWFDIKGARVLPTLWAKVRTRMPNANLTIVGAGKPAEAVLPDFAGEDRASVTVIPRLTDERELEIQYADHDVFVMPSLSEGSSLALLEAMASGMPVVASAVGGNPDIVTDGINGLLFPPIDADLGAAQVCRVLEDSALAERLGKAARERAVGLTWQRSSEAMVSAMAACVREPELASVEQPGR